jgi:hypothetical protein
MYDENGFARLGSIFSVANNEHLAERVPVPGDERVLQPHPRFPSEGCRRYGIITMEQQLVTYFTLFAGVRIGPPATKANYCFLSFIPFVGQVETCLSWVELELTAAGQ